MPLSIGTVPKAQKTGPFLGLDFGAEAFQLVLGIAKSGRGVTMSSARCS